MSRHTAIQTKTSQPSVETNVQAPVAVEQEQKKSAPELKIPKIDLPKIGRNDTVVISKGGEVQELKFKKAERLIKEEGWTLVKW